MRIMIPKTIKRISKRVSKNVLESDVKLFLTVFGQVQNVRYFGMSKDTKRCPKKNQNNFIFFGTFWETVYPKIPKHFWTFLRSNVTDEVTEWKFVSRSGSCVVALKWK